VNTASHTRGRPLFALVMLMLAWIGVRTAVWDSAAMSPVREPNFALTPIGEGFAAGEGSRDDTAPTGPLSLPGEGYYTFSDTQAYDYAPWPPSFAPARRQDWHQPYRDGFLPREPMPHHPVAPMFWNRYGQFAAPRDVALPEPVERSVPVRVAIAHQMMWMAAVSRMPLPAGLFANLGGEASTAIGDTNQKPAAARRWSMDAWLLHRRGGNGALANGLQPATYGASQFGSVLRYRLAKHSGLRPTAYLWTTSALNGSQEKEAAVGLSARPLSGVPVAVAAEMRATSRPGSSSFRPAVLAWTEIPPFRMPMGARGEFYAQGGYVAGKHKTAFADGQLRVDRDVAWLGRTELRAGGGAWAGIQKGASRVDAGPGATVAMPISKSASARLAVDWRFRLAGNAEPKSGPAVTLSAGF